MERNYETTEINYKTPKNYETPKNYKTPEINYGLMFVKDVLRKYELIFQNNDFFSHQLIFKIDDNFVCVLIIETTSGLKFALRISKSMEYIISYSDFPTFFFPKYFQKNLKLCLNMMKTKRNFSLINPNRIY